MLGLRLDQRALLGPWLMALFEAKYSYEVGRTVVCGCGNIATLARTDLRMEISVHLESRRMRVCYEILENLNSQAKMGRWDTLISLKGTEIIDLGARKRLPPTLQPPKLALIARSIRPGRTSPSESHFCRHFFGVNIS
jgi:hypothetical protein